MEKREVEEKNKEDVEGSRMITKFLSARFSFKKMFTDAPMDLQTYQ